MCNKCCCCFFLFKELQKCVPNIHSSPLVSAGDWFQMPKSMIAQMSCIKWHRICINLQTFSHILYLFMFKDFTYLPLDRGEEGKKRGRAKHQCAREMIVASYTPPTGDLACNPGTCPNQESNRRQPFRPQASTQTTEPQQSGHLTTFF